MSEKGGVTEVNIDWAEPDYSTQHSGEGIHRGGLWVSVLRRDAQSCVRVVLPERGPAEVNAEVNAELSAYGGVGHLIRRED